MNPHDLINGYVIVLVAAVVLKAFRSFWLDLYRQDLFELRDELFDRVLEGRASFHDAEYTELREELNSRIRWAHFMSTPMLLPAIVYLFIQNRGGLPASPIEPVADALRNIAVRMRRASSKHMIRSAPTLLAGSVAVVVLLRLGGLLARRIHSAAVAPFVRLDSIEPGLNRVARRVGMSVEHTPGLSALLTP